MFYAGHGFQVKGENYLVPVDTNIKGESDVPTKAVNLGQGLSKLEDGKSRVNMVILDKAAPCPELKTGRCAEKYAQSRCCRIKQRTNSVGLIIANGGFLLSGKTIKLIV